MSSPVMTLTNMTATGDVITGPGCPTVLFKGLPAATITTMVAGAVCVSGVISGSIQPNVLAGVFPLASLGAPVTGVSVIGVPVSTVCAVTPNMNDLG